MFQIFKDIYDNIAAVDEKGTYQERLKKVIEDVATGKLAWSDIPRGYLSDRVKICRGLLEFDVKFYDSFEDAERSNHDVIKKGIMVDRSFYSRLPDILKNDVKLACFHWSCYPNAFSELPEDFRENKADVVAYISNASDSERYFKNLSQDEDELEAWAKIFIEHFIKAVKAGQSSSKTFSSSRYLRDGEYWLELIVREPFMINHIPRPFFNEPFFLYKLFKTPYLDLTSLKVALDRVGEDLEKTTKGKNIFNEIESLASREIFKEKDQDVLKGSELSKLDGAL